MDRCDDCRPKGAVPFLPYQSWLTQYTPVIPKLYWDVDSAEQRIKALWRQMRCLNDYMEYLSGYVGELEDKVAEMLDEQKAWVTAQLSSLEGELKRLIEQVTGSSLDWDVTAGELAPTMVAHRNLYWWATPHGLTVEDFNAAMPDLTVSELAESGMNCQGWSQYGDFYAKSGTKQIPRYYLHV